MSKLRVLSVIMACFMHCGLIADSSTNSMHQKTAASNPALAADTNNIRVVVCESLIKSLSETTRKPIVFIALSEDEKRLVRLRIKDCDIRDASRAKLVPTGTFTDRVTGESGIVLEIKSITLEGRRARVRAGYFVTAGVVFDFILEKEAQWVIKKRSSPTITE